MKNNSKAMKPNANRPSSARFDARLTVEQKEMFERAALLLGYKSLSEFIIQTVHQRAKNVIEENEKILGSQRDAELFFESILNDHSPNEALIAAAEKYKKSIK